MQPEMLRFTLCFLTRGDDVLMIHRRNPPNQGFRNGIGGRIEPGESPTESVLREIREETGFRLDQVRFAGLLTWEGFEIDEGGLYLFTAEVRQDAPVANEEGELAWKPLTWVLQSPEVVSNIPHFAPAILRAEPPKEYRFSYKDGVIQNFIVVDLPEGLV